MCVSDRLECWTNALLTAAPLRLTTGAPDGNAIPALPLAPWAWPLSQDCGPGATLDGGAAGASGADASGGSSTGSRRLATTLRPSLSVCLAEAASNAASTHRRVMIWLRDHDGVS